MYCTNIIVVQLGTTVRRSNETLCKYTFLYLRIHHVQNRQAMCVVRVRTLTSIRVSGGKDVDVSTTSVNTVT